MPTLITIAVLIGRWILRVVGIVFLADLVVGAAHWLEDRYGKESWPLVGPAIIAPNLLHHEKPRAFLAKNWWQSADLQLLVAIIVATAAWSLGWLTWELVLFLAIIVNANQIHKWEHRTRKENGHVINFLQDWHIVQSRAEHGLHHGGDRDSHYCVVTPWANRICERAHLWRVLEWTIAKITGVQPRVDPVVIARQMRAAA
jgi:plasmanylethanolamine desaturase